MYRLCAYHLQEELEQTCNLGAPYEPHSGCTPFLPGLGMVPLWYFVLNHFLAFLYSFSTILGIPKRYSI